ATVTAAAPEPSSRSTSYRSAMTSGIQGRRCREPAPFRSVMNRSSRYPASFSCHSHPLREPPVAMMLTRTKEMGQVASSRGIGLDRERWRILIWMCVLITANQLGFGAIVPVVPLFAQQFGVSQSAIGLTIAVFGLARFLVNVPAARIA